MAKGEKKIKEEVKKKMKLKKKRRARRPVACSQMSSGRDMEIVHVKSHHTVA